MRIIYVTACMPFGTAETFVIDEAQQLLIAHEVLIVPRSPRTPGPHPTSLLAHARREALYSPTVLSTAVRLFLHKPLQVLSSSRCLLLTRSPKVAIRNFAVLPNAL